MIKLSGVSTLAFSACLFVSLASAPSVALAAPDADWASLNQQFKDLLLAGKYDDAMMIAKREVDMTQKKADATLGTSYSNLGDVQTAQGQFAEAGQSYRRAVATNEKVLGLNNPAVASDLYKMWALFLAADQGEQADSLFKRDRKSVV